MSVTRRILRDVVLALVFVIASVTSCEEIDDPSSRAPDPAEETIAPLVPSLPITSRPGALRARGWLGLRIEQGTVRDRRGHSHSGALVTAVVPEFAAAIAGIRVGDLIVAVEGRPVFGAKDIRVTLNALEPGQEIELSRCRGTSHEIVRPTLASQQEIAAKLGFRVTRDHPLVIGSRSL